MAEERSHPVEDKVELHREEENCEFLVVNNNFVTCKH